MRRKFRSFVWEGAGLKGASQPMAGDDRHAGLRYETYVRRRNMAYGVMDGGV